jgi:hypothetical protein
MTAVLYYINKYGDYNLNNFIPLILKIAIFSHLCNFLLYFRYYLLIYFSNRCPC